MRRFGPHGGAMVVLAMEWVSCFLSDLLLDCVELCKSTRAAVDIYRQCQIDDYGFTAKDSSLEADRDPYTEWSFQDIFNEDGIVLDPVSVLPVQYEITTALLPSSSDPKLYPLDCSCLSSCSYVEVCRSAAGLRLLVNSFSSGLQHVTSNNMDLALSSQLHDRSRLLRDRECVHEFGKTTLAAIKAVAIALLQKVLNCRVVDCDLAIGYCTLLPKKYVLVILWKVINNTWQNYDKILTFMLW
ncbi:hypothetical protein AAFF_G00100190 [Aldrovandia affinis]|uniref:KNTC1 third ARM-repeats domain-containing protein n=1 Tax=Aldrovandia affinis TaxID=143900 RepID=A0AAD7RV52_9TELE|nr:hypothetical protein AAFF_G00100190 [Aldrovandia affinis]